MQQPGWCGKIFWKEIGNVRGKIFWKESVSSRAGLLKPRGAAGARADDERHHVSAGWRDALWWMGSCYLPGYRWVGFAGRAAPRASLQRVGPQNRFCGPRDHSIHQLVRG
jgi:hypothetical protein